MNVSGPRGLQAQDHCKYARIADHFTPVIWVAYRCYAGGLRSHRLPRLWISSIGSVPGQFSPSNAAFGEYLSTLFSAAADRIEAPTQHWSIAVWNAFRSEREHSGELQIILLFVGTARELTKDEYFVGCNALALHQTGRAHLMTVLLPDIPIQRQEDSVLDPWTGRSRALVDQMSHYAVAQGYEPTLESSADTFLAYVLAKAPTAAVTVQGNRPAPLTLFFSYCHRDGNLRDELEKHLRLLERTGLIRGWHDRDIVPGDDWAKEIDVHIVIWLRPRRHGRKH